MEDIVYVLLKQQQWNCYNFYKETARTIITVGEKETRNSKPSSTAS